MTSCVWAGSCGLIGICREADDSDPLRVKLNLRESPPTRHDRDSEHRGKCSVHAHIQSTHCTRPVLTWCHNGPVTVIGKLFRRQGSKMAISSGVRSLWGRLGDARTQRRLRPSTSAATAAVVAFCDDKQIDYRVILRHLRRPSATTSGGRPCRTSPAPTRSPARSMDRVLAPGKVTLSRPRSQMPASGSRPSLRCRAGTGTVQGTRDGGATRRHGPDDAGHRLAEGPCRRSTPAPAPSLPATRTPPAGTSSPVRRRRRRYGTGSAATTLSPWTSAPCTPQWGTWKRSGASGAPATLGERINIKRHPRWERA